MALKPTTKARIKTASSTGFSFLEALLEASAERAALESQASTTPRSLVIEILDWHNRQIEAQEFIYDPKFTDVYMATAQQMARDSYRTENVRFVLNNQADVAIASSTQKASRYNATLKWPF